MGGRKRREREREKGWGEKGGRKKQRGMREERNGERRERTWGTEQTKKERTIKTMSRFTLHKHFCGQSTTASNQ